MEIKSKIIREAAAEFYRAPLPPQRLEPVDALAKNNCKLAGVHTVGTSASSLVNLKLEERKKRRPFDMNKT